MLNITVIGVGRIGRGPENELAKTYISRIQRLPQKWSLNVVEIDDRSAPSDDSRKSWDAQKIMQVLPKGTALIALDERGKTMTSEAFATRLGNFEISGQSVCFTIGGPDGLDDSIRRRAHQLISFGAMTWPHKLVRAMLLEQLYRAGSIASGHPYHRAG